MKKFLASLCLMVFCVSFAYTPTAKDKKTATAFKTVITTMYEKTPDKFEKVRTALEKIDVTKLPDTSTGWLISQLKTIVDDILNPKPVSQITHTISVIDGDTIKYDGETIRMIGLDTPESNTTRYGYVECYGFEATAYLKTLLKDAKELTIEKDPGQGEKDKYDRTLGYVLLGTTNINGKMIADGYAFEYTYDKSYKYQKDYKAAEKLAKDAKLGLWSSSTCNGDRKKGTKDEIKVNIPNTTIIPIYTPVITPVTTPTTPTTGSYTCGSKKYCSEMTTCEEAKYYLNSCGLSRLDADKDGIPCESICN